MIDELFFEGAALLVAKLIRKAEELIFLRQFVAGEIDMDRTDYLLRDSLHCGVDYGKFDFRQLLKSLTVFNNQDTGRLELAITRGGEHTFEALILARYQMTTQVYCHKVRRIYDHYLLEYMRDWLGGGYKKIEDVLNQNDQTVWQALSEDSQSANTRTDLAKRILERRHHRVIYQTSDTADQFDPKKSKQIVKKLETDFGDSNLLMDVAEGSIHKLTVPGQHEEAKVEDFFLIEKWGQPRVLTEDSAILQRIPKNFRVVRIYADAKPDRLQEVAAAAAKLAA